VALEGSILIKPSRETGAEIALDRMPSNVAIEKTSVAEEGIWSGRGAGGGSQIHYSSEKGRGRRIKRLFSFVAKKKKTVWGASRSSPLIIE
jgi:hypothetical protein